MGNQNKARTVSSVELSCDILDTVYELDGAGVTEIAERLDRSKSTIHNHLVTLKQNNLVVQRNGEYYLTFRFIEFGQYVRNKLEYMDTIKQTVEKLADATGEISHFMIEENGMGTLVYSASGESAVQVDIEPGTRTLLHCTSLGKAILSELPERRVSQIIKKHGLPSQTPNTITDRAELSQELKEISERGYAIDNQEVYEGLQCIAAPVEDTSQDLVGAISLSGPVSRMEEARLQNELKDFVQNAVNIIQINIRQPDSRDLIDPLENGK